MHINLPNNCQVDYRLNKNPHLKEQVSLNSSYKNFKTIETVIWHSKHIQRHQVTDDRNF